MTLGGQERCFGRDAFWVLFQAGVITERTGKKPDVEREEELKRGEKLIRALNEDRRERDNKREYKRESTEH
jgi:hypothetical protein